MDIQEIKNKAVPILLSYGVSRAGIFGSAARQDMNQNSDIDIVVDITSDIGLLEFIDMKQKLEEKFEKKIDLVEYKSIKPSLKEGILGDEVAII